MIYLKRFWWVFFVVLGFLWLTQSCTVSPEEKSKATKYDMECYSVGSSYLRRCENTEVVCYRLAADGGLSCKFKEPSLQEKLDQLKEELK